MQKNMFNPFRVQAKGELTYTTMWRHLHPGTNNIQMSYSIQHSKEIDISEELKNIKNVAYKFATTFKQVFVRKNNIEILEIKPCFITIVVEGFEKNENEQILENGQDIIEILQFTDSTEEQVINCYDFTYPTLHSHLQTENYYLNAV